MKSDYKHTEVGMIPKDWKVIKLGKIASVATGGTPSRDNPDYWDGNIPWITTTQINFNTISRAEQFITRLGLQNSAAKLLAQGTLLMALYGQGKTRGKVGVLGIEAATNQACATIVISSSVSHAYVFHFLTGQYENIRSLSNYGSQKNLNGQIVKSISLTLPSTKVEQETIAEVLRDADTLIESLEQLITKKRQIKQGTMQELLTAKERRLGFYDEWESKTFGEIFEYYPTATNSRSDLSEDGDTYYFHYGDIHTRFHNHLDFNVAQPPRIKRSKCRNAALLRNGDWIMVDASEDFDGVGKAIEILGLKEGTAAVAGLHTFLLRERSSTFVPGFKGHLGNLKSLHEQFLRVATGMKVFGVSKAALKDLTLPVPSPDEQTAIATILSDMESEITALEEKLTKVRQIKQGMMQELLTGRIRLV